MPENAAHRADSHCATCCTLSCTGSTGEGFSSSMANSASSYIMYAADTVPAPKCLPARVHTFVFFPPCCSMCTVYPGAGRFKVGLMLKHFRKVTKSDESCYRKVQRKGQRLWWLWVPWGSLNNWCWVPGPNLELGVDFIPDLVDVPSALIVGLLSGLTSAMNTILSPVHRESFCTSRVEMLLNKQTKTKSKNKTTNPEEARAINCSPIQLWKEWLTVLNEAVLSKCTFFFQWQKSH